MTRFARHRTDHTVGGAAKGLAALQRFAPLLLALLFASIAGCFGGRQLPPPKLLLIGIDGADWKAIRRLWDEGQLPHLKSIADAGSSAVLQTAYGPSPVIWTTIATGLRPPEHGIEDFVVATPQGDRPVSSTLRKAPALWNMLSDSQRDVAALGWWGSWPAEQLERGAILTDRVGNDLEDWAWPPLFAERLRAEIDQVAASGEFPEMRRDREAETRDLAVTVAARRLLRDGTATFEAQGRRPLDLVMAYYRNVDIVCHRSWKYWEPDRFPDLEAEDLAAHRDDVPRAYRAVDQAVGELLAAGGGLERLNVLVVSDHGFRAAAQEEFQISLNFDRVLERLGYLKRTREAVAFDASRVYTFASAGHHLVKKVRFALAGREAGATLEAGQRAQVRADLTADLARFTWKGGQPMFRVRDANAREAEEGADFSVVVDLAGASETIFEGGEPWRQSGFTLSAISGTHGPHTHGILMAAGPAFRRGATIDRITIHDMAPTMLYAVGLPYGRDFAGRPVGDLFTEEFRAATPLRAISSWGRRRADGPTASAADQKLVEELRALGYLD